MTECLRLRQMCLDGGGDYRDELYKNIVFLENRFTETIFKRIGLHEDLFSY